MSGWDGGSLEATPGSYPVLAALAAAQLSRPAQMDTGHHHALSFIEVDPLDHHAIVDTH
jgi:allophanate hydrolase subunit 2